jgi:hypothetical protein
MERQSDKHSPRVDEEMKRQVAPLTNGTAETRAQEARQPEPPADGEPMPDEVVSARGGPASLTHDEIELRQELARFLDTTIWPATREEIIDNASAHHATEVAIAHLKRLPERTYPGFPDVWEAISGHNEPRRI